MESSGSCRTDLMRTRKKDNWEKSQKMFLKIICNSLTSGKKCRGSRKNERIGITALHCRSGLHVVLWVTRCDSSSEESLQNTKINISEGLWNLMACGMWGRQWATCQALQVNPPRAHSPFQAVWGRTERRNLTWSPISRLAQLFYQSPDLPLCSQWAESLRASWLRFQEDWLQWLQSKEKGWVVPTWFLELLGPPAHALWENGEARGLGSPMLIDYRLLPASNLGTHSSNSSHDLPQSKGLASS